MLPLLPGTSIDFKQHRNERGNIAYPREIWKPLSPERKNNRKKYDADVFRDKKKGNEIVTMVATEEDIVVLEMTLENQKYSKGT